MTLPEKIVMATGNPGKVREIARLLAPLSAEVVAQSEFGVEEAVEDGTTFEANSLIKARHAAAATGLPAIADDSGLAVDALDGSPGVYSARYAGPDADDEQNIDKLLEAMRGQANRAAAFHCVASFVDPNLDEPIVAHGIWRGEILDERRGAGGFGYDPVFLVRELGVASAELDPDRKNELSHRGQALRALVALLEAAYAGS
ncbi:MAG: RdgB/HAM1 family non-canonical purine NTP pyrophosphatase [Pseudomonadota bacterium]